MSRLLEGGDFDFLSRQPGFDARLARQIRAERRRVFALYLNRLVEDFECIHSELLSMNMSCPDERSEAAFDLMLQRVRFHGLIGWVRCQLVLHRFGLAQVDVRQVLRFLPTMQARAQRLATVSIAA